MEQNKKEEKGFNFLKNRNIIIIAIIILGGIYLILRSSCVSDIYFFPATEKPIGRGDTVLEEARYEFWPEEDSLYPRLFQTRKEAIAFCMSQKI